MCGAADYEILLLARDNLFAQPGEYPIVKCRRCGLVYVNPRPTVEALPCHYPDNYFAYTQEEDIAPLFRRILTPLVKTTAINRIRYLERVIGRLTEDTRVVDVGCGTNQFLRYLQELRGCVGIGVDFNAKTIDYVRRKYHMPVVCGTLLDAQFKDDHFDLVTMHEYLEHEPNPQRVLTEARRITRCGGHICIEIPYIDGLPAKLFRSRWSQYDVPRHLVFFTQETLATMLQRCGYKLITARTFGAPFIIGMSVLHSLGFHKLGGIKGLGWLLVGLAGAPFLPFVPILREGLSIVARAE